MAHCHCNFQDADLHRRAVATSEEAAALLARTELFAGFDPAALKTLAPLLVKRTYGKGQILFHQGDPGDSLFVLATGLVKVNVTSPKGDEMLLVTLTPPATFGELSLIDGNPRSASVEVVEPATVLIVGADVWARLMRENLTFRNAVQRSLVTMVRRLTDQASDFAFLDLHGRVAKMIVRFADERGTASNGDVLLDLHLTQSDIANMVGGSRQSVNQILRSLEDRGYLELERQAIVVKQLEALRRRAGL